MKRFNETALFEELFCLGLSMVSLISWYCSSYVGLIVILCVAVVMLLYFNDFKYIIPSVLYFIFSNNQGFDKDTFPIPLILCGGIFLLSLIVYVIKNGFHLKKAKSSAGIGLLGISCLLPLAWYNVIPKGQEVLYFIYFAYVLYFLVYILFSSSLKHNSFRMLCITMEYTGILLALECLLSSYRLHIAWPDADILNLWYYVGWGLCNEAGILMCMILPFIFIRLIHSDNIAQMVLSFAKLGIVAAGMLLTTSRATYFFGSIEFVILFILAALLSKRRKDYFLCLCCFLVLVLIVIEVKIGVWEFVGKVMETVFKNSFHSNERLEIWKRGISVWNRDFISMTFGSGMVAEFMESGSFHGMSTVFVVYHSTILETLAAFGIVGALFMGYHFYEKYRQLKKTNRSVFWIMLAGYCIVDIYGCIDNTYSMYYYMIPLVIIMATLDASDKKQLADIAYY